MQLLADIRLHRAHLALTSPQGAPPPGQVARSVGFTQVTRFTRAYQRRYGTTPAATTLIMPAPPAGDADAGE